MAPVAGLAPTHQRFKGVWTTLSYTGKSVLYCIENSLKSMEGFDATIRACEALGLDVSNMPMAVLHAFYISGIAFASQSGVTAQECQIWRDSVIWPSRPKPSTKMEVVCIVTTKK
jgi:hypothetical protein